jgi:uncharacterized membrane protein YhaH (DUF805 family)
MAVSFVPMVITFYGVGAILSGAAAYAVAAAKHRDASHWGFLGFVFPPFVLLTLLLPPLTLKHRRDREIGRSIERHLADRDDD